MAEYFMEVDVRAESDPDAELVFDSKGYMHRLKLKNGVLEGCKWTPKIIADDRANKANMTSLAEIHWWEKIVHNGREYFTIDEFGRACKPSIIEERMVGTRDRAICIGLFDWPIHGPDFWGRSSAEVNASKLVFGKDRKCFAAKALPENRIESYWCNTQKSVRVAHRVCFKDDDLV
ncbi:MAG: hypothetical protein ABL921_33430, partial [Pirellula sp.]